VEKILLVFGIDISKDDFHVCAKNEKIKELYERITERNPQIKKKGVVAGMRKLLILIFVLWKKNEEYDPHHEWQKNDIG